MGSGVVHIVQRMAPGGIETLVLDLLRSGSKHDKIYSLDGRSSDLLSAWGALDVVANKLEACEHAGGLSVALLADLTKRLRRDRPEAVFVHHIGPFVYGGIAARLAGVPVVVHVEHDGWHLASFRRRTLTRLLEAIVRPRHVAVSHAVAAKLRESIPAGDIRVIANGVDLGRFVPGRRGAARQRLGIPADGIVVGSAGRLIHVKGHDVLVRAAALLPAAVRIVIVGGGEEAASLIALAREVGVADRVILAGHRDDIPELLPAFDVFCLPSRNEGLPRGVIEAQACGVPVVATRVGGLAEAVCPETGFLVPPEDPVSLAGAIRSVLNRVETASPRGFVEAHFDWGRTLAAYRQVLEVTDAA